MKKAFLLVTILCLAPVLQAGITKIELVQGDAIVTINEGDALEIVIQETYSTLNEPYVVEFSGEADEDPIVGMIKKVTNESDVVWTVYSITLGGNAAFVSASSNLLPDASVSSNYVLFSGGTVKPGETLAMSLVVNVPVIGNFKFCLTQLAIPEPASMLLLGLGGLGFLGRKQ